MHISFLYLILSEKKLRQIYGSVEEMKWVSSLRMWCVRKKKRKINLKRIKKKWKIKTVDREFIMSLVDQQQIGSYISLRCTYYAFVRRADRIEYDGRHSKATVIINNGEIWSNDWLQTSSLLHQSQLKSPLKFWKIGETKKYTTFFADANNENLLKVKRTSESITALQRYHNTIFEA